MGMFYTYVTHSRRDIKVLMRALEAYQKVCPFGMQDKVRAVYEKVREAYYYKDVGELHARAENERVLNPKDMTLAERVKFIVGGE